MLYLLRDGVHGGGCPSHIDIPSGYSAFLGTGLPWCFHPQEHLHLLVRGGRSGYWSPLAAGPVFPPCSPEGRLKDVGLETVRRPHSDGDTQMSPILCPWRTVPTHPPRNLPCRHTRLISFPSQPCFPTLWNTLEPPHESLSLESSFGTCFWGAQFGTRVFQLLDHGAFPPLMFFFLHQEGPSNREQQHQPVLLLDEAMEDEEQLELDVFWGWNIEFQPGIFFEQNHHNNGSRQSKLQILMHTSMWPFL